MDAASRRARGEGLVVHGVHRASHPAALLHRKPLLSRCNRVASQGRRRARRVAQPRLPWSRRGRGRGPRFLVRLPVLVHQVADRQGESDALRAPSIHPSIHPSFHATDTKRGTHPSRRSGSSSSERSSGKGWRTSMRLRRARSRHASRPTSRPWRTTSLGECPRTPAYLPSSARTVRSHTHAQHSHLHTYTDAGSSGFQSRRWCASSAFP